MKGSDHEIQKTVEQNNRKPTAHRRTIGEAALRQFTWTRFQKRLKNEIAGNYMKT